MWRLIDAVVLRVVDWERDYGIGGEGENYEFVICFYTAKDEAVGFWRAEL